MNNELVEAKLTPLKAELPVLVNQANTLGQALLLLGVIYVGSLFLRFLHWPLLDVASIILSVPLLYVVGRLSAMPDRGWCDRAVESTVACLAANRPQTVTVYPYKGWLGTHWIECLVEVDGVPVARQGFVCPVASCTGIIDRVRAKSVQSVGQIYLNPATKRLQVLVLENDADSSAAPIPLFELSPLISHLHRLNAASVTLLAGLFVAGTALVVFGKALLPAATLVTLILPVLVMIGVCWLMTRPQTHYGRRTNPKEIPADTAGDTKN